MSMNLRHIKLPTSIMPEFTIHGFNYTTTILGGWEEKPLHGPDSSINLIYNQGPLRADAKLRLLLKEQLKALKSYSTEGTMPTLPYILSLLRLALMQLVDIGGLYEHEALNVISKTTPYYGLIQAHTYTKQYLVDIEMDLLDPFRRAHLRYGLVEVQSVLTSSGWIKLISIQMLPHRLHMRHMRVHLFWVDGKLKEAEVDRHMQSMLIANLTFDEQLNRRIELGIQTKVESFSGPEYQAMLQCEASECEHLAQEEQEVEPDEPEAPCSRMPFICLITACFVCLLKTL
ncbi:hypothetical protein M422DRAFT_49265 [Sphaerobolus stellatus SS14]|uniref:Uncharacterized protein n=1 Tax=Sphaerobolus stellatus (strain SS14) TaxID=990650 RepID=A0A0C9VQ74_SPHS4|nr:hypothetical protein M422DRAFT_49265 [Sphaerobolus stellatus SS14]